MKSECYGYYHPDAVRARLALAKRRAGDLQKLLDDVVTQKKGRQEAVAKCRRQRFEQVAKLRRAGQSWGKIAKVIGTTR